MNAEKKEPVEPAAVEEYINRELSWLGFARRVFALAGSEDVPLLERVKFAGIMGMLLDEFSMKRLSGLKRRLAKGSKKVSAEGFTVRQLFDACRAELVDQENTLNALVRDELRPALEREGVPLLDHDSLTGKQRAALRRYFEDSVLPILTPLAVDAEHPFPFISNLGLNLLVPHTDPKRNRETVIRIKVPGNRPRWVPVPGRKGFTRLEQVIAANLDLLFAEKPGEVYSFRVTRGAEGEPAAVAEMSMEEALEQPGSILRQVSGELKARKFAGVVRLQVSTAMPKRLRKWLATQLAIAEEDVYPVEGWLGLNDLLGIDFPARPELSYPLHRPVRHPRLGAVEQSPEAIFEEISRGDILLHHPYQSFDSSVLRFVEAAAEDPRVLAIKLTIYRTSSDSPMVKALAEAARQGKQVAVLVEITARFDEAPNIAWGRFLEKEGVHVSYGVERLKTHVKLALVVREEGVQVRRYVHVGTGNYHTGTARIYEDLGLLTADPEVCDEVAAIFNSLTGSTPHRDYRRFLVAPVNMRRRFEEMIRAEAEHARAGRPSGIHAKMNQLQDAALIRELYAASRAGVPISLNVRGLCCLKPGVPGMSASIRVYSVVGRFLEHSRLYRFENGGEPRHFLGSADWMKRNLDRRVETIVEVADPGVKLRLDRIISIYEQDNCSAWDCDRDGSYALRAPAEGEERRAAQEIFIQTARG